MHANHFIDTLDVGLPQRADTNCFLKGITMTALTVYRCRETLLPHLALSDQHGGIGKPVFLCNGLCRPSQFILAATDCGCHLSTEILKFLYFLIRDLHFLIA